MMTTSSMSDEQLHHVAAMTVKEADADQDNRLSFEEFSKVGRLEVLGNVEGIAIFVYICWCMLQSMISPPLPQHTSLALSLPLYTFFSPPSFTRCCKVQI